MPGDRATSGVPRRRPRSTPGTAPRRPRRPTAVTARRPSSNSPRIACTKWYSTIVWAPTIAAGPDREDTRKDAVAEPWSSGRPTGRRAMEDRRAQETVGLEEHEQLRRDFAALQEQFEAADGVLSAIGRSAADPETVLTTIVESALRLCRSHAAYLCVLEDGFYRLIKSTGLAEDAIRFLGEHPMRLDRESLLGRVGLERRAQQIPDVLADPDYGAHDLQRIAGYRTT